jgi:hypothetical protein
MRSHKQKFTSGKMLEVAGKTLIPLLKEKRLAIFRQPFG